jgi:hypothetical protein
MSSVTLSPEEHLEAQTSRAEVDAKLEQEYRAEVDGVLKRVAACQRAISEAQATANIARNEAAELEAEIAKLDTRIERLKAERLAAKHDREKFRAAHGKLFDAESERERLGLILGDARHTAEAAEKAEQHARLDLKRAEFDRLSCDTTPAIRALIRASAQYYLALNALDRIASAQEARAQELTRAEGGKVDQSSGHESLARTVLRPLIKTRSALENFAEEFGYHYGSLINAWAEELRLAAGFREPDGDVNYSEAAQVRDIVTGEYAERVNRLENALVAATAAEASAPSAA